MRFLRLVSLRGIGPLLAATIVLAGCGGGSHAIPAPSVGSPSSPNQTAPATFVISVPRQQGSIASDKRSPRYITSATQSIRLNVTLVNGSAATFTPVVANVSSCPADPGNSSNFQCTVSAGVPIGTDTLSIGTYDQPNAGGNLISQQFTTVTVKQGVANGPPAAGYTFTLDANPKTITVAPPGTGVVCPHNPVQAADSCTINGTSALAFTVTVSDAHGTIIANNSIPGSPLLSASSGTAGVASVSAAQNPYAVTITPSGTSGSSVITVTANPSTGTSQLASTQFQFTVQTVPSLLALGQATSTLGQINVYTLSASAFANYGVIPSSALGTYTPAQIGFDTANDLYMFDNNNNAILRFPSSQLSLSSGQTFTTITNGITGLNRPLLDVLACTGRHDGGWKLRVVDDDQSARRLQPRRDVALTDACLWRPPGRLRLPRRRVNGLDQHERLGIRLCCRARGRQRYDKLELGGDAPVRHRQDRDHHDERRRDQWEQRVDVQRELLRIRPPQRGGERPDDERPDRPARYPCRGTRVEQPQPRVGLLRQYRRYGYPRIRLPEPRLEVLSSSGPTSARTARALRRRTRSHATATSRTPGPISAPRM
jgi:hypothetical protein